MKSIKYSLVILSIIGFVISAGAQENEEKEMKFLFGKGNEINISGFGGPFVGFTSMGDEFAVTTGGGGAVLFNQSFYIGGYGEGIATIHEIDFTYVPHGATHNTTLNNLKQNFGHGGFWIGYIHKSHQAIHWGISSKLGFGSVTLNEGTFRTDRNDDFAWDNVFVANPQIEVEMNLLKWFKINLGFGYQFVTGFNKEYPLLVEGKTDPVYKKYFDSKDFNKPIGHITFCFGWFTN